MKDLPPRIETFLQGYRASRILLTAVELDLFSALKDGASSREVSERIQGDLRATKILLHALASLQLIQKKGKKFFLTKETREFLTQGGRHDWRLGIGHHFGLWEAWSKLTTVVRKGHPESKLQRDSFSVQAFIGLMHQFGLIRAPRIAKVLPVKKIQRVLDLGGGSGVYSMAMVEKNPKLYITLLDRPEVIPLAQKYIKERGWIQQYTFRPGDLTLDDFGKDFDLVFISSICHMLSPKENEILFQKAFRSLRKGGQLVVHDFILNSQRTHPLAAALFAVNMLVNTHEGNSYSEEDYREWMKKANFEKIVLKRLTSPSDLILGRVSKNK